MNYGFLINNQKCIGCHACSTACKSENQVALGVFRTWVKYTEVGNYPDVRRNFQVTRCNHCANPPCVDICPVEAMHQRPDGIVGYDSDLCIGCKSCMQACPYNSIHIDPVTKTAQKCHFCAHRVENGIEPACVVVCPQHAIVAGDLDNPKSEISREVAKHNVTVRKPEQGTSPKLFYVDGHQAALTPLVTEGRSKHFIWGEVVNPDLKEAHTPEEPVLYFGAAEQMVQTTFNVQHKVPWHWQVPAYLTTKGIAAGAFMLLAAALIYGWSEISPLTRLAAGGLAVVFSLLTTVFLVWDLERPERFLQVILKHQWKSWLVRGAFILIGFSNLVGIWWAAELATYFGLIEATPVWLTGLAIYLGFPLAIGAAIYTAFLFGQAEGRDFWQSPLLPFHFLTQAVMAGGAALLLTAQVVELDPGFYRLAFHGFTIGLSLNLMMILLGEFGMKHPTETASAAAHMIVKGQYKNMFWGGAILLGNLIPFGLALAGQAAPAALLAIVGLYLYEHVFVMAPQKVPNS
ncbi:MAG: 4Fe-4S ferredoxin [Candidatus Lambdaproteobacteria bacterium RIFOXYD1_FULL_56_27]|uniref:4Fe-4S ferredoxin n=1 Tax=Candidatus Lambdaproteobacteria bacterium RIFOXYD2_FULL_56_26 TaxID=1817773 RepID=A0A1F6GU35_9PROT|nr:MAG: 4Fe-4S ferredoxin [Candidatus Lambdaproteobacteria bacterium RIFOXYC1_FULL_56_13]OGH01549.1 MAG: 4Fe-4S ferredoxin [Candidatus Lambdaproteobacteria bacterium RIFOXYD2_FULL_56_26]OGH06770.1 MAG: 4Fe-4S ferredoxin [Candidatus Lambdaproteobacteria bacterium RIFOXYD1_FULL_56_27]